jgi:hypothetical protein
MQPVKNVADEYSVGLNTLRSPPIKVEGRAVGQRPS